LIFASKSRNGIKKANKKTGIETAIKMTPVFICHDFGFWVEFISGLGSFCIGR
jgi:hypothetical protein